MAHEIVQQIIGEIEYVGEERDQGVWRQIHGIAEQNGLPYDMQAEEVYDIYRTHYGEIK